MWEIRINREKIKEMVKKFDERNVSRYILKGCRQEIVEPTHDIIECFL